MRISVPIVVFGGLVLMTRAHAQELPQFDELWDFQRPDQTEAKFRELLPRAEAAGEAAYVAELNTQIARALGLQQKFDQANLLLDDVEASLTEEMARPRARLLLERGRVLNSSGKPEESVAWFKDAFEVAETASEHGLAVDALHMLGIVEPGDKGLAWNRRAIDYAEQSGDEKAIGWLGSLYNNTGWTYHGMGEYGEAQVLFEKALDWHREHGGPRTLRIARWTVARGLRSLGRVEQALEQQVALRDEMAQAGDEKDGYVYEEIGECLTELGREPELAKASFAQAYQLLSQDPWLQKNEAQRLNRLAELGGLP